MVYGAAFAGIIIRVAEIGHWILGGWVNATNAEEGGQLDFAVVPAGVGFARWSADVVSEYAGLLNALTHLPELGAAMAKLLLVLIS